MQNDKARPIETQAKIIASDSTSDFGDMDRSNLLLRQTFAAWLPVGIIGLLCYLVPSFILILLFILLGLFLSIPLGQATFAKSMGSIFGTYTYTGNYFIFDFFGRGDYPKRTVWRRRLIDRKRWKYGEVPVEDFDLSVDLTNWSLAWPLLLQIILASLVGSILISETFLKLTETKSAWGMFGLVLLLIYYGLPFPSAFLSSGIAAFISKTNLPRSARPTYNACLVSGLAAAIICMVWEKIKRG
ncbi:hypothetical protein HY732_03930 [Candidatus Uhrbacteria bacterium]|nr:hypothetical protein [Candidatus Uhrbacteria bacterium]